MRKAKSLKPAVATCDAEIVVSLMRQLVADCGRGFEEKSLRHMMQFAEPTYESV